ncbi:YafY family protein [Sphaerobacter sp.]|uniref:helix-turn-helix transcriptional regulator n=1 Tax=Sphaerobacter sp. TaxID=2099654 RepID=UPI001D280317|nr:YafY family protein [Sphaerobacter sp.]MBX5443674.1 YafY family transcriptional regulator [Sphaerobacter sp.]
MRADRLLSILLLLQVHRRMTARELAERLEVSPRTIQRDMEALSMAGVPVYAERGARGGWVLPDDYRTDLSGLTGLEIEALFLTKPARPLADLGYREAAEGALLKLLAALPTMRRREAERARQRLLVDTSGWRQGEDPAPCLPALQDAVWRDRRACIVYRRSDGTTVERVVDPLGLVAKGSLWYLVAAVEGHPRTYRVARVQDVEVTEEPCERPEGFDLAAYWTESTARFVRELPRYPFTLRAAPEALHRLGASAGYVRAERIDPPGADGWSTVHLVADVEEVALGYVLGFGDTVEVLAPPALRQRVLTTARNVVAFYEGRGGEGRSS